MIYLNNLLTCILINKNCHLNHHITGGLEEKVVQNSKQSLHELYIYIFREFQPMASAPDDNSLSSDQDTNQFLV